MLHELSELLQKENNWLAGDTIIRSYLKKKAGELRDTVCYGREQDDAVRRILGLDGVEEPKSKEQFWCIHMDAVDYFDAGFRGGRFRMYKPEIDFCYRCGTPRPKEKGLAEKIEHAFRQCWWDGKGFSDDNIQNAVENITKAVEFHFKGKDA
jgi:hypothetical protein